MENKKPVLKQVKAGQYRYPSYFTADMKKYGKSLIGELIESKMLATVDLELAFDYITNVFLLQKVNEQILMATDSADLKRLQTVKNGISNNMLRESNALGLNIQARKNMEEMQDRYDYVDSLDFFGEEEDF